ncbi:MAG: hypothetical protein C0506_02005 [Anaerolinea sp.]|nr:hypothetical protein [Anaerolinea sp.]
MFRFTAPPYVPKGAVHAHLRALQSHITPARRAERSMSNEKQLEASAKQEPPPPDKIFVSHAHGDRKLASALSTLIDEAFAGRVGTFQSSDTRAAAGLQPGNWPLERIHHELRQCTALWALATPLSVKRPWLYWETGIASVLHPERVTVVRVGLAPADVPNPLSAFFSFDGLSGDDGGIGELLDKFAHQMGQKVHEVLMQAILQEWFRAAIAHEPIADDDSDEAITAEQIGRFESAVSRLESLASEDLFARRRLGGLSRDLSSLGIGLSGNWQPELGPSPLLLPTAPEEPMSPRRALFNARKQQRRDATRAERERVIGETALLHDLPGLTAVLESAPQDVSFRFAGVDWDGDAELIATRGDDSASIYLNLKGIDELLDSELPLPVVSRRTNELLSIMRQGIVDADAKASNE